jgi:hypothetical protein
MTTTRFILMASFGLAIALTYFVFLNITASFLFVPAFAQDIEDPVMEDPARLKVVLMRDNQGLMQ